MKMKKIILFALMSIISLVSYSQSINGLGKFKLGSNISIINEFGEIGKIDGISHDNYDMIYSFCHKEREWAIVEYIYDTNKIDQISTGSIINANPAPLCRTFEITNPVKINDEVTLEEVRLIFINDTLVSIETSYSSALNEALDLKYGKIEPKITETPHKFTRTIDGSKITLTDFDADIDRSTIIIECHSKLHKYYSGSIEPKYFSYFILQNKNAMKKIKLETSKYKKRAEERIEERKKQNLKDF